VLAINTGAAAMLSIEDARPFWHPFITAQTMGLMIAYAVNVAQPWTKSHPVWRLACAVALGSLIGVTLVVFIKGYLVGEPSYHFSETRMHLSLYFGTAFSGFIMGLCVSFIFLFKFREAHAAAALHMAEAERHLMSKHAIEAELKLMQAQVEPHFLFNTLASIQYLTETDPREAGRLLSHLIDYLRAALPQLRASSTTLGKEVGLASAYLNILKMRMGARLAFDIDVPADLAQHAFPPNLLISLVENAIKHGVEPAADGGAIRVIARHEGAALVVSVTDTGRGSAAPAPGAPGDGVGLANVRDRLAALYGAQGRFTLSTEPPHGTRATLSIPFQARD
jgi:Histidine kinase/Histidine kinase-, DNA gyrase B-, and HSP90-like ATPase